MTDAVPAAAITGLGYSAPTAGKPVYFGETADAYAAGAAAERQRWRAILADHYLMGINCDPDTHRDNPMCGCSRIHLGWHESIGAARQAWIDHVAGLLEPQP